MGNKRSQKRPMVEPPPSKNQNRRQPPRRSQRDVEDSEDEWEQPLMRKSKGQSSRGRRQVEHSPPAAESEYDEDDDVEVDEGVEGSQAREGGDGGSGGGREPIIAPAPKGCKARGGWHIDLVDIMTKTNRAKWYDDFISLLEKLDITKICALKCNWYPRMIEEFYESLEVRKSPFECTYRISGVGGAFNDNDWAEFFGMTTAGVYDYPDKGWSNNWTVEQSTVATFLNNGHSGLVGQNKVRKDYLNGLQKLVLKVVMSILLPTNNQDSILSQIHAFLTYAIVNAIEVNVPRLMISHMAIRGKKGPPYQYGMVLSEFLVRHMGVSTRGFGKACPPPMSKIDYTNIVSSELYTWEGELLAKWELNRKDAETRRAILKANKCVEPRRQEEEASDPSRRRRLSTPPPQGFLALEYGDATSSAPPMSDRQFLESIQESMATMQINMGTMQSSMWSLAEEQASIRRTVEGWET